jgi:hypothetical protein
MCTCDRGLENPVIAAKREGGEAWDLGGAGWRVGVRALVGGGGVRVSTLPRTEHAPLNLLLEDVLPGACSPLVHHHCHGRDPLVEFVGPVGDGSEGHHDQEGAVVALQIGQGRRVRGGEGGGSNTHCRRWSWRRGGGCEEGSWDPAPQAQAHHRNQTLLQLATARTLNSIRYANREMV